VVCKHWDLCVIGGAHWQQGQALPEDVARLFFQQIMVAVDYSHRMGVANRDIKLDNILLHRQVRAATFTGTRQGNVLHRLAGLPVPSSSSRAGCKSATGI